MSVRKRAWTTTTGERRESWIVDYVDGQGDRHIATFARKKDAEAHHATVRVDVGKGVHTPHSKSPTVAEAAERWIERCGVEGLERATLAQYRQHVANHINPRMGREKLSSLTVPRTNAFRDDLLKHLSRAMARKVLTSLKSLLKDAQRRGSVAQNVASDVRIGADQRGKRKLKAGVDIPTPNEITRMINVARGRWRPLVVTAAFAGLRASELRGLCWADIDLKKGELHVRQRADRYGVIGRPKSRAGTRTIPLGPFVLNTLRAWKLQCPKGEAGLVFPNARGRIEYHTSTRWGVAQVQITAGLTGKAGKARYGLHDLRHFYASLCINRTSDGGLELPAKVVQERLGHSSIVMTMDTYGHLFPRGDDGAELAAVERAMGLHAT